MQMTGLRTEEFSIYFLFPTPRQKAAPLPRWMHKAETDLFLAVCILYCTVQRLSTTFAAVRFFLPHYGLLGQFVYLNKLSLSKEIILSQISFRRKTWVVLFVDLRIWTFFENKVTGIFKKLKNISAQGRNVRLMISLQGTNFR